VLRYGNTRELVLGLEVVLPDGRVWNGLRALRKDNTGYDLKHLFVGAEGTLGIITAAVMKLFPKPRATATAMAAVEGPREAVALLGHLRDACGDRITAFEFLPRICIDFVLKHIPACATRCPNRIRPTCWSRSPTTPTRPRLPRRWRKDWARRWKRAWCSMR
jgi:FAD/FMN-containing dehydrogenase